MTTITPLQESIYTLNFLHNKLLYYHESGTKIAVPKDAKDHERTAMFILDITLAFGIVLVNSFVQEYDTHLFAKIDDTKRKAFIQARCKPALKEIRKFKDLGKYRNFLAHGREGKGLTSSNILVTGDLYEYNIPQNYVEYCFVLNCIEIVVKIVNHVYPDAYAYVKGVKESRQSSKISRAPYIAEDAVYEAKLQALKDEINNMPNDLLDS